MNIFFKVKNFVINLLFPDKCIFCNDVIPIGSGKWICPDCMEFTNINTESYGGVLYLYVYEGYVREMLHRFKYYNHPEYAVKLGELTAQRIRKADIRDADLIIPVPMHEIKKRKRGYNQAELLAEETGKILSINVNTVALIRNEYTKAQSLVKMGDRAENVRNVFKVTDKTMIEGKNIILIDDIYTSGSTMSACVKELKGAGAKNIYLVVVALAAHRR